MTISVVWVLISLHGSIGFSFGKFWSLALLEKFAGPTHRIILADLPGENFRVCAAQSGNNMILQRPIALFFTRLESCVLTPTFKQSLGRKNSLMNRP